MYPSQNNFLFFSDKPQYLLPLVIYIFIHLRSSSLSCILTMSDRRNSFHTNGNQNFSGNPDQNYHIGDSRNLESWTNYGLPQNLPQPFSSSASYSTNNAVENNQEPNYPGFDYFFQPQSCQNGASISTYNTEISSDILARAANSQLTATAGEFIPNSSYQSSSLLAQGNDK